jgi:hypothetical protein
MKKCNIPHAPWPLLERYIKVLDSMIPKDQIKYNNSEVKYGATFYGCHTSLGTCCCDV